MAILLIVVAVVAAIANSPCGIFLAEERSSSDAVSIAGAVASVNAEYNAQLEALQTGDYDHIDIQGAAADWPEVLTVFAARYAVAEAGVFRDMTEVSSTVETIHHTDSDPDNQTDDSWTERTLHISISARTAADMKAANTFSAYQITALDELLSDRAALASLAGSLEITSADALAILQALPADLEPERKAVVQSVLSLCGKVSYFWGGKSLTLGRDSRWGQLRQVTAAAQPPSARTAPKFLCPKSALATWPSTPTPATSESLQAATLPAASWSATAPPGAASLSKCDIGISAFKSSRNL